MRLINRNTGEIVAFGEGIINLQEIGCENVADMLEQGWEDYKEPESKITHLRHNEFVQGRHVVEIDYIDYREAERAVKKLEAWKRLRDKGFKFDGWETTIDTKTAGEVHTTFNLWDNLDEETTADVDLLFGGEDGGN